MYLLTLLQFAAQQPAKKPQQPGMDLWLIMLVPLVIFFFWMMRSQKKREQKRKDMIGSLKKGDKVVTIGGIHGEITRLNDREVTLIVDKSKGIELRLLRTAIASPAGAKEGDTSASVNPGGEGGIRS